MRIASPVTTPLRRLAGASLAGLLVLPVAAAAAAPQLTLYRGGLALVQEQREASLQRGENTLDLAGLSERLLPDTVLLEPGAGVQLEQQRFEAGSLTPARLLQAYVGRQVQLVRTNPVTGEERREPARILSTEDGVVLAVGERIETGVPGRLLFPQVPPQLHRGARLQARLAATHGGAATLGLSYLSEGIGWDADYAAVLDAGSTHMDLSARASLHNDTEAHFRNARVALVAGTPHRAGAGAPPRYLMQQKAEAASVPAGPVGPAAYHRYSLPRPVTLEPGARLQVMLFRRPQVKVERRFLLEGEAAPFRIRRPRPESPAVQTLLRWRSEVAMPAGVLRVYGPAADGTRLFLGEDRIGPAPADTPLTAHIGQAFELRAEHVQTAFERRPAQPPYEHAYLSGYRLSLHNAGAAAAEVVVREPIPGDWHIEQESAPHRRTAAGTAEWTIEVPAHGEAVLEYRVLSRF